MNDDLISRSALKAVISEYIDEYSDVDNQGYHCEKWCAMKETEMAIDNAPPAEPQKIVTIPSELIEKLAKCVVDTIGNIDWEKAIEAYMARPQDEIIKELWNCRNELCLKCERYKEAYRGACEDCRYNFKNMEKWKESPDEVADDKYL